MAVDWIKMRTDLYRDPKVSLMADILMDPEGPLCHFVNQNCHGVMSVTRNVTRNAVVGALLSTWGVLRHRGKRNGDDLEIKNCTLDTVDDISDLPGFGLAMESSGWVVRCGSGLNFPCFFEEYNVDPTNGEKAQNSERQRRFRERKRNALRNVTLSRKSNVEESKSNTIPYSPLTDQIAEVLDSWNKAPGVCKVRKLDNKRKKHLEARLKELDWPWLDALSKFPLPCFSNSDGWKPDFDWFVRPDTCDRILEGKYDWTKESSQPAKPESRVATDEDMANWRP